MTFLMLFFMKELELLFRYKLRTMQMHLKYFTKHEFDLSVGLK